VPSSDSDAAQMVAARADGATLLQRTSRCGADLHRHSRHLWKFFRRTACVAGDNSAALVFSWLADRGQRTTRIHPCDVGSVAELRRLLGQLLADKDLFSERLVAN